MPRYVTLILIATLVVRPPMHHIRLDEGACVELEGKG
jgi:hypothetical protein